MPGDYSKLTFDPLKDHALLRQQQGRVHLDADANELAAILERRLRVGMRDTVGAAAYPVAEASSFEIQVAGAGLTIGSGRMYVDGLLAENHGGDGQAAHRKKTWPGSHDPKQLGPDPVWGEPQWPSPVPFARQPYQGAEPTLKPGRQLVYLDVWQRETTHVEEPSLVEPALGVDTTTRLQTAWRVRGLPLEADARCSDDWEAVPEWRRAIRPSDARLTTAAVGTLQPDDPCAVSTKNGYRSADNRLYRVEVHHDGEIGEATVKWSRDNGAVASRVEAVADLPSSSVVTVASLGRDATLRFAAGDWVELLDDVRELDGEPGEMARVARTDAVEGTVTLDQPLKVPLAMGRNPRIRRWDHDVPGDDPTDPRRGTIPVTTSPQTITLEHGVEVIVELETPVSDPNAKPRGHTGDHWTFSARPATGEVDLLLRAVPEGVRHHYARLAIVDVVVQGSPANLVVSEVIDDCRVAWPADCECEDDGCSECTRCVSPESHASGALTIQGAIDEVSKLGGGRVCLDPGDYRIEQPLRIDGARGIAVSGAGRATVLQVDDRLPSGLTVHDSASIRLEEFVVLGPRDAETPFVGIALANTTEVTIEGCTVLCTPTVDSVGIGLAGNAIRSRITRNVVGASVAIGDVAIGKSVTLRAADIGLRMVGTGVQPGAIIERAQDIEHDYLQLVDLTVADNLLLGEQFGVRFGVVGEVTGRVEVVAVTQRGAATIADNTVVGGAGAGISLHWGQLSGTSVAAAAAAALRTLGAADAGPTAVAIDGALAAPAAVRVTGNVVSVVGHGISASCGPLVIADNTLAGTGGGLTAKVPLIGVRLATPTTGTIARTTVASNRIVGFSGAGVVAWQSSGAIEVVDNEVRDTGAGGIGVVYQPPLSAVSWIPAARFVAARNALERIGLEALGVRVANPSPELAGLAGVSETWGIRAEGALEVSIDDNTFAPDGVNDTRSIARTGIMVAGALRARITGNRLPAFGPPETLKGSAVGILHVGYGDAAVSDNVVHVPASPAGGDDRTKSAALVVVTPFHGGAAAAGLIGEGRSHLADVDPIWRDIPTRDRGNADPHVLVRGNELSSRCNRAVALIAGGSQVTFSDNHVRWGGPEPNDAVLIGVVGPTAFNGNQVAGPPLGHFQSKRVVQLGRLGLVAAVGNATRGSIAVIDSSNPSPSQPLAAPWSGLNVRYH